MSNDQNNTVLLCPGQGAQHVGMAKAWHDNHPVAADIFRQANEALGFDLTGLCLSGPEETLNRTDMAQVAIYTASVACHNALVASDIIGEPTLTAGLSLGEFTALHLAGAFDFLTGLELVRLRGQAMQDAAGLTESSMVALIGADEAQALALCEEALDDPENKGEEVLVPANFNCPGQIVISGTLKACERAESVADKMGIRSTQLAVAGAFHSPLMQPAADRLAEALDKADWNLPTVPVLSNVTAKPHENDIASIKQRLVDQLTQPVRWSQSMQHLLANPTGDDMRLIELAPGKVLSGLMRRIDRKVKVENHAKPA
jgi:[acyl-carrier-protein] S-malonyltransferase